MNDIDIAAKSPSVSPCAASCGEMQPESGKHKPFKAKSRLGRFLPDFAEIGRQYENKQVKAEGLRCFPSAVHGGRQRRPHKALRGF